MNYIRSRFLNREALHRSNPLNSAENVLREYRHRRRHRKDLNKVIDESKENCGEGNVEDEKKASIQNHENPVQQSNSFRRRRNESGEENPFTKRKMELGNDANGDEVKSIEETSLKDTLPIVEHSYISTEIAPIQAIIQLKDPSSIQTNDDEQLSEPCISHLSVSPDVPDVNREGSKVEEEEDDPLGFIAIKSAAQWVAVSKRISWNFEGEEVEAPAASEHIEVKSPLGASVKPLLSCKATQSGEVPVPRMHDYENVLYDIFCPEYNSEDVPIDFKPTKVQQLRLICWKIKPWKQPKGSLCGGFHGGRRLFTSTFAAPWGADCDEVYPGLFIGDKASATNVAFLQRYGITHVLNAAEGNEEGLVDLNREHYQGTDISYWGFPLWDAPGCNLTPYLGIAADYIYTAIDEGETERSSNKGECKILVNCQMGVSRSASCAMAYLMIHKSFTAVEALTLIRKSRDCRPNDGFLSQLIHLDNQLRLEREHSLPRTLKLSTWQDRYRLPLSWHKEFWIPSEVSEEELGFPLVPMGQSSISWKSTVSSSSLISVKSSRSSSKRNSFRARLKDTRVSSRCSSFKRSRPTSISLSSMKSNLVSDSACEAGDAGDTHSEWEWVWETDDETEDNETNEAVTEKQLEQVTEIIGDPEEKWRHLNRRYPSSSSLFEAKPRISVQAGVEDNDPMSLVKVASAKQWKQISRKLTINFDDLEEPSKVEVKVQPTPFPIKTPLDEALEEVSLQKRNAPPPDTEYIEESNISQSNATLDSFKPTTVQELRRLCWQIKPWDHPAQTFAERQLFTSILGSAWGVDADEVFPKILVGDQAAARNIAFLKRFGITHVLNAAEGPWPDHCVDLTAQYYTGTSITYLGLPLFDSTQVKILPYLGIAAEFIKEALENGKKCLVNCQMGVSRSCSAAMAYLMIYQDMSATEILRAFRKRRDVRPNDFFMEQLVELDNDLRKSRELGMKRSLHLPQMGELPRLPKPWHYEFWNEIPDDLPFDLSYCSPPFTAKMRAASGLSKRASLLSTISSDWEWEYYDETDEE